MEGNLMITNHESRIMNHDCAHAVPRGGMLVELLLTIAIVAIVMPFLFSFQRDRIERAQNIAITQNMNGVRVALERYIDDNKKTLLSPLGKNITRVKVSDLIQYGAQVDDNNKFQIRVLKSSDRNGHATLQGIVVLNDDEISPIRTREIVNLGGGQMGFAERGQAFGAFGTWRASVGEMGLDNSDGIIDTTRPALGDTEYLMRMPSLRESDATMLSALNIGGHNIINSSFVDSDIMRFEEILKSQQLVANAMVFQSRTTIDEAFQTSDATVSGTLSADSRSMDISGTLTLAGTGKFSSFETTNLWVNNLNLSGLSVSADDGGAAVLKTTRTLDMVAGYVNAMYTTVGFAGSVTPQLTVNTRIEDTTNPSYFWDVDTRTARFADVSFAELNRMAPIIVAQEKGDDTETGQLFSGVATNKNATASDFINILYEIENRVRAKYNGLNLE
jgi:type II secretory pathway pseudopilin PulG